MKLFCDLDGTLIDVAPRHYRVYQEVVAQFDGHTIDASTYWDLKRKKTKWPTLLEMSGLSPVIEKEFLNYFIEKIESPDYLKIDALFDGVYEILESMSADYELYLVSLRRNEANLHQELRDLGIYQLFVKVLSGHSESDGYDKKIELIRTVLAGDTGVIIGDTEADIVTGKELGLTTIAVKSGIRDETFLAGLGPDYLLDDFSNIKAVDLG